MDARKRSMYGQTGSGIPKPRPSAYSAYDSGIPKPSGRATLSAGMGRQSSGYGLSRPSAYNPTSAVKSVATSSARKSIFFSARKSHTPQTGRSSFNPSSVTSTASRQSIGGQRSVNEDRPIAEISYHKQCVAKLNDFLQQMGQPVLPPRFCASPSSSDIRRAFELLFREMGMNLNQMAQPPKSWDQELPDIMRSLGYRYTIAKKFIVSSTSNHSKGQLFGMFEWLVDAISYCSRSGLQHILYQDQDQGVNLSRELFKVALCSDPAVREEKLTQIGEALYGTEQELQQMMQQDVGIQQEVVVLDQEIQQVEEMKRLMSELENECVKFDRYAQEIEEQLEAHRETAVIELPLSQNKILEVEALIKDQEKEKKRITDLLGQQEFGQEDLKWARERQQQLKDEADREVKAIEEQKRSLRDIRLTVKQEEDKLFKMQSDVQSLLMSLKEAVLSPSISPYVQQVRDLLQGKKLEAATHFLIQPISLAPDASEKRIMLRELVREYKMQLVQQTVALEGSVIPSLQQKINDLQTAIAEVEKATHVVKDKITQLNHEIEADRHEHVSEHARLKNEYALNQTFLKDQGEKLKKSEAETADRVRTLTEVVSKQEAELKQQKSEQSKWLLEYTSNQRNIFSQIQQQLKQKVIDAEPYEKSLEEESVRQKGRIDRLHKKIADYKASKQQKK